MLDAYRYFKVTNRKIYNENVKSDIKISIIGDIHISRNTKDFVLDNIINELKREKADYICLVGDIIDTVLEIFDEKTKKRIINFIEKISQITTTIIILGSHDYIYLKKSFPHGLEFWNRFQNKKNIYLLNDEIYKDDRILFMGYREKEEYYFNMKNKIDEDLNEFYKDLKKHKDLYKNLPDNILKVGLIHSPEFARSKKNINLLKDYDILISGHNHQGCMPIILDDILKGNRGIVNSKKQFFKSYTRGIMQINKKTKLLITGGIEKISDVSPDIFKLLNHICYRHIDTITFTNKEEDDIKIEKVFIKKN